MNKKIRVGSDFSGVGAFDYAIQRVSKIKNFEIENVFACDMDKYARLSYLANHKEPNYYPENVYEREIPKESLDIFMTSPPCQAFSLAGKRKGKLDKRGILFFNSHEFIQENKPRFFIFENVKGLLSDDNGKTFQEWINMLGGKSVNGLPIIFPFEESVPYHLYYKVLNTKKYGVPQNRERVFIIGIRDDEDNNFQFPKEEILKLKLKDLLEEKVDEKYFLSDKIQSQLVLNNKKGSVIGTTKPEFRTIEERDNVHNPESYMSCLTATDYKQPKQILVKLINKKVSVRKHDVDVLELQKILKEHKKINNQQIADELKVPKTMVEHWFRRDNCFSIPDKDIWLKLKQLLKIETDYFDKQIMEFEEKDNVFEKSNRAYDENGIAPTMTTMCGNDSIITKEKKQGFKVRKLTPLECFRLQDFPDSHVENSVKVGVSDSQLYKQAGNSITVRVLEKIIEKLKL